MTPRFIIADQSALGRGGHYLEYTSCIAHAARAQGMAVVVFCNRRLQADVVQDSSFPLFPVYTHTWGEVESSGMPPFGPGNMVYETLMALQHIDARPADHLLLHTLGLVELRAWLRYLLDCPLYQLQELPHLHLLLRFDPAPLETEQGAEWLTLQQAWHRRAPLLAQYLHFCADTERLAQRYQALLGSPFSCAPIPFDVCSLRAALQARPARPAKAPVRVLYLGDARLEKGFLDFPDMLAALWPDLLQSGRLEFVFQANPNVPGGEGNIMQAIRSVCQYPPSSVRVMHEALMPQQYFAELAACDIVLLPYSAQRYHSRSSGILVEALAAGKPVLTSAGSWMSTQVTAEHALLFEAGDDLADALRRLLKRLPQLRKHAQKIAAHWQGHAEPAHYLQHLLQHTPQPLEVKAPEILFVMDGDSMVLRNGASQVATRQLRYLFESGYRVRGVFISSHYARSSDEAAQWNRQLGQALCDLPFVAVHTVHADPASLRHSYLRQQTLLGEYSIRRDLRLAQAMLLPAGLLQALRERRPDLVFLNYITMYPLLEALGVTDLPVVCETHDIQSFQKAIYGRRLLRDEDLELEFKQLARCRYLISLNDVETAWLRQKLPQVPVQTLHMNFDLRSASPALRMMGGMVEVLAASGPQDVAFQIPSTPYALSAPQLRAQQWQTLDLLFVSSSHQSNVSGLDWFLREVFLPHLAAQGVTLLVAGSIREARDWPEMPGVLFCGRVQQLDLLYAACRLCVLPITEGAGGPIKTIEALSYGKPLLATSLALRGLPPALADVVLHADLAQPMAKQIKTLLGSARARSEYAQILREAMRKHADPQIYRRSMDRIFKQVAELKPLRKRQVQHEMDFGPLLEWTATDWLCNQVVRAWLEPNCIWNQLYSIDMLAALPSRQLQNRLRNVLATWPKTKAQADWLRTQPDAGLPALQRICGLQKLVSRNGAGGLQTSIVLSGLAQNTLVLQLARTRDLVGKPQLTVHWCGQALSLPRPQPQGKGLRYLLPLPLDSSFTGLRPMDLHINLEEQSGWHLEAALLQEEFNVDSLAPVHCMPPAFHEIECSMEGRNFAWTRASEVWCTLPCWRGKPKLLMLDAYSLRGLSASQIEVFDQGQWRRMRAQEGSPVCMLELDVLPQNPLSAFLGLRSEGFGRASDADQRLIGIGLHGLKVVGAI